jgi:ubiquinone/menaquinone biosynthesis C-methylase UbiE
VAAAGSGAVLVNRAEVRSWLVRTTFNAAAAHFDDAPLFFWEHCGTRTVALAGIGPGHRVLDACCGTGASAIPAARLVGPQGTVVGVDIAARPLAMARAKAARLGLANTEFVCADMTATGYPDEAFDVVLCVLGIYFAEDLPAAVAGLWRLVRPGGTLAVTTWGRRLLEPANTMFHEAVGALRPDLRPETVGSDRINEPATLARVFTDGGAAEPVITLETVTRPTSPDDFWTVVLGSGYRLQLDVMGADAADRVRTALRDRMEREGVREVTADLLYATAAKPVTAR